MSKPAAPAEATLEALERVARSFGTPAYAYDLARLRRQLQKLEALPASVEVLYSLKANPAPGICQVIADFGLGADVVSVGELEVALQAGFAPRAIFASGPYKPPQMVAQLRERPETLLSIDSRSEWVSLSRVGLENPVLLRLRPDFRPLAGMPMGPDSRFGFSLDDLPQGVPTDALRPIGFHVYAGSQVLDPEAVTHHLRASLEMVERAAERLRIEPQIVNLGGGFGVAYGAEEHELDLGPIGEELSRLVERARPARLVIELGRYLVAQSGWYLSRVVAHQSRGNRRAVVVDGGVHQRADLCGLSLRSRGVPPVVVSGGDGPPAPTDVLGCLCLPDDILAEGSSLPPLEPGDLLAFPNAGAYGLTASPCAFLSHPSPPEVAFDGANLELLTRGTHHTTSARGWSGAPLEPLPIALGADAG